MKLYFTNQTADRHYAREVELKIEKATGIELDNPFYDGDSKEVKQLDATGTSDLSAAEIVAVDLKKIRESDGILALYTHDRNIGSSMEVAIASFMWGLPVYIITQHKHIKNHPWVQYFGIDVFDNAYEFINWYNKKHKKSLFKLGF